MSTGDMKNNLGRLKRALKSIKYNGVFDEVELRKGTPDAVLPLLHYTLLSYSRAVAQLTAPYELYSKTDARFLEGSFRFLRQELGLSPKLTTRQFLTQSFAERKVLLMCDVITKCIQYTDKALKQQARKELTINERKLEDLHTSRKRFQEQHQQQQDGPAVTVIKDAGPQRSETTHGEKKRGKSGSRASRPTRPPHAKQWEREVLGESLEQPFVLLGDRPTDTSSYSSSRYSDDVLDSDQATTHSYPAPLPGASTGNATYPQDWNVEVLEYDMYDIQADGTQVPSTSGLDSRATVGSTDFVVTRPAQLMTAMAPHPSTTDQHHHQPPPAPFDRPSQVWTRDDIPTSSSTDHTADLFASKGDLGQSAHAVAPASVPATATTADLQELCGVVSAFSDRLQHMTDSVNARFTLLEGRLRFIEDSITAHDSKMQARDSVQSSPTRGSTTQASSHNATPARGTNNHTNAQRQYQPASPAHASRITDPVDTSAGLANSTHPTSVHGPDASFTSALGPQGTSDFVSGLKQRLNETKLLLEATKKELTSNPASPFSMQQLMTDLSQQSQQH